MFPASVPVHAAAALTVTVTASVTSQVRVQGLYRATKAPELTPFSRNVAHSAGDRTSETTTIASNVQGDVVALSVDAVTAGIKRGTVYVVVQLASYAVTLTVARGYVYEGVPLQLGQYIEPGPGGGEGSQLLNPVLAATAVGADFILDLTVPTNAYWNIHHLDVLYQAAAVAGTRNVIVSLLDEDSREMGVYTTTGQIGPITGQSARIILTRFGDPTTNRPQPGTGNATTSRFLQSGPIRMSEGYAIRVEDIGDIEATDTVAFFGVIEEWLAPP